MECKIDYEELRKVLEMRNVGFFPEKTGTVFEIGLDATLLENKGCIYLMCNGEILIDDDKLKSAWKRQNEELVIWWFIKWLKNNKINDEIKNHFLFLLKKNDLGKFDDLLVKESWNFE